MTTRSRSDAHWRAAAALGCALAVLLVPAGVALRLVADPPDHFSSLYPQEAAAFQPVRRRVQDLVDRRFNRARFDSQRTVTEFAATLRDAVDLDVLEHRLVHVAQATVQTRGACVWPRQDRP